MMGLYWNELHPGYKATELARIEIFFLCFTFKETISKSEFLKGPSDDHEWLSEKKVAVIQI